MPTAGHAEFFCALTDFHTNDTADYHDTFAMESSGFDASNRVNIALSFAVINPVQRAEKILHARGVRSRHAPTKAVQN